MNRLNKECVGDDIHGGGWSYQYRKLCTRRSGDIWLAIADRHDGHRYVARSETLLSAFMALKKMLREADQV